MFRWIKLLVIFGVIGFLIYFSFKKIDEIILRDIEVVNLEKIYNEKGFPVNVKKVMLHDKSIFIKDLAFVKLPNSKLYRAYSDTDLIKSIKVGSDVLFPRTIKVDGRDVLEDKNSKIILGKVVRVSGTKDWRTGFYAIDISFDEKLEKSTFYSAKVVFLEYRNVITVPRTYLQILDDNYFAWIVEDNVSKELELNVPLCDGYSCYIKSGLKVGDLIISSDTKKLFDGKKVRIVNDNESQKMGSFKY